MNKIITLTRTFLFFAAQGIIKYICHASLVIRGSSNDYFRTSSRKLAPPPASMKPSRFEALKGRSVCIFALATLASVSS